MEISLLLEKKSQINLLNTFYNKDNHREHGFQFFQDLKEIYVASRLIFDIFEKERIDGTESPLFGKLFNLKKPITIIPSSFLIYTPIEDSSDVENNEEEIEEEIEVQRISKLDYINHFYSQISEESLIFNFKDNTFEKYALLQTQLQNRLNQIERRQTQSTILRFLNQTIPNYESQKKIAPYLFIERESFQDSSNISNFFQNYQNFLNNNTDFLLYIGLDDFSQIDLFDSINSLAQFHNVFVWIPDFCELYPKKENIMKLKTGLVKLHRINPNIIFLYGGLIIYNFFNDLIKELVFRVDIYPGRRIIPHKEPFGTQRKKIFFPFFGRVTTPEKILDSQFRNLFECSCYSCIRFHTNTSFQKVEAIEKLDKSHSSNFYHNIFCVLKKIHNNEPVEVDPDQKFEDKKLFHAWEKALE